jgi:thiazole/oxazole-forming peptide maturase SagD family component
MLQLSPLDLQQGPAAALLERVRDEISPPLAAVAGRLARAFLIGSPWAPGFCCVGAELALESEAAAAYGAPRLSVAGNGESLETALVSCLGEAVDRLAVVERPGDVPQPAPQAANTLADTWIAQAAASSADTLDWIEARDVVTGEPIALPADLCLRRVPERRRIEPAGALSAGVAAGPDYAAAALRAALELYERDAAALWWLGGQLPLAFPLEHPASLAGVPLIAALRRRETERRTMLLDITTDLGVPAVAAFSLDREGRGLACGLAARLDWAEAARAAILEMCQMELAAPLAAAKRAERGDGALNEVDRLHLARAAFAAAECELLRPCGVSELAVANPPQLRDLRAITRLLSANTIRLYAIDLTRPEIGVAAARIVSPDLQPYSADVVSTRLRACRIRNQNRHMATVSIPLM